MDLLCSSHSVLSATDWQFHPLLTASHASLLSQPISPLVKGLPQMWEPLLCFSYPPGVQVPSRFLSSSFSLLSFILPSYVWIFIVLSSAQSPLLVFSQCSVRIIAYVAVILMHLWREMNSMSPYSSTILKTDQRIYLNVDPCKRHS